LIYKPNNTKQIIDEPVEPEPIVDKEPRTSRDKTVQPRVGKTSWSRHGGTFPTRGDAILRNVKPVIPGVLVGLEETSQQVVRRDLLV